MSETVWARHMRVEVDVGPSDLSLCIRGAPIEGKGIVRTRLTALYEHSADGRLLDVELFDLPEEPLARLCGLGGRYRPPGAGRCVASLDYEAARLWFHLGNSASRVRVVQAVEFVVDADRQLCCIGIDQSGRRQQMMTRKSN